ncbi:hypothetical protein [Truepera radiovictrix]|uniref:Uncharacterized protein n=1 Tax=Truepera radiovictrix (strain DSM 17093 / CIP 108686 / LMG 22925 / RQ-24) TaxID=649638 RepID=D7CYC2_TRURR|nr:hypothetical protein [Truepera radiovictrix]ADI14761.1 hypothetical protein Trad_1642 [Truepera radiovictrix DSM 17093]WMT56689.1 hypothetical protein RCV51_11810 [Truepera radiovictrix]
MLNNAKRSWGRLAARVLPRLLLPWLLGCGAAFAQFEVEVEVVFGFEGEIVADAWNPVRVSLRDAPDAELLLELDRGTLRGGERWLRFRAPLAGGGGRRTFEEVIFIPAWQQFVWSVRTPDRVLASGSVERRRLDPRPLHLVLSRTLGAERDLFDADARVLEVYGALPERASAFDGVATVVVGDTLTPSSPAALAAAAAGGSTVLLLEPTGNAPLPEGYDALFGAPLQRLGAGWLARSEREEAAALLAGLPRLERRTLEAALLTPDLAAPPPHLPPSTLLWALFGYALAALLLVRYGRLPGLWSALLLATVGSLAGFWALRGEEVVQEQARTLVLAGGPLAQRLEGRGLFSPARRDLTLDTERYGLLYPLDEVASPRTVPPSAVPTLSPSGLRLSLGRYEALLLARRPELEDARFYWRGDELINAGSRALEDLFILGRGQQKALAADSSLRPELGDNLPPDAYTPLLPHLPRGSALARDGDLVLVALPTVSGSSRRPSGRDRSVSGSSRRPSGRDRSVSGSSRRPSGREYEVARSDRSVSGSSRRPSGRDRSVSGSNHRPSGRDRKRLP